MSYQWPKVNFYMKIYQKISKRSKISLFSFKIPKNFVKCMWKLQGKKQHGPSRSYLLLFPFPNFHSPLSRVRPTPSPWWWTRSARPGGGSGSDPPVKADFEFRPDPLSKPIFITFSIYCQNESVEPGPPLPEWTWTPCQNECFFSFIFSFFLFLFAIFPPFSYPLPPFFTTLSLPIFSPFSRTPADFSPSRGGGSPRVHLCCPCRCKSIW